MRKKRIWMSLFFLGRGGDFMDDYMVIIKDSPIQIEVEMIDRKSKRKRIEVLSSYFEKISEANKKKEVDYNEN